MWLIQWTFACFTGFEKILNGEQCLDFCQNTLVELWKTFLFRNHARLRTVPPRRIANQIPLLNPVRFPVDGADYENQICQTYCTITTAMTRTL